MNVLTCVAMTQNDYLPTPHQPLPIRDLVKILVHLNFDVIIFKIGCEIYQANGLKRL
jgi:hypothetical protein